jgi:hypothetical protein
LFFFSILESDLGEVVGLSAVLVLGPLLERKIRRILKIIEDVKYIKKFEALKLKTNNQCSNIINL